MKILEVKNNIKTGKTHICKHRNDKTFLNFQTVFQDDELVRTTTNMYKQ